MGTIQGESFLSLRKFVAPEFVFGRGARHLLVRYLKNFGTNKVLVITDTNLRLHTPWIREVEAALTAAGITYTLFDQLSPNPRTEEIMAGAAYFRQQHCNTLLAIGGGSVMDGAKAIGIVAADNRHILEFEGVDQIVKPIPPLLCIPTTAGTASEVSQFAIVLDTAAQKKIAIVSKAVLPDAALIDPELTVTMDPFLTLCSGMDALTHALEAYVSNASSPLTDVHADSALRLLQASLPNILKSPDDIALRGQVLLGSLHAGLAFSNAIVGATHAMAHSLGGLYDLPHGECNALFLAPVAAYNYQACPEKYQHIGRIFQLELSDLPTATAAKHLAATLDDYRCQLGLNKRLTDLKVQRTDVPILVQHALTDPCLATNPRPMTQHDLEVLFYEAF